jgi:hypothetical protein
MEKKKDNNCFRKTIPRYFNTALTILQSLHTSTVPQLFLGYYNVCLTQHTVLIIYFYFLFSTTLYKTGFREIVSDFPDDGLTKKGRNMQQSGNKNIIKKCVALDGHYNIPVRSRTQDATITHEKKIKLCLL